MPPALPAFEGLGNHHAYHSVPPYNVTNFHLCSCAPYLRFSAMSSSFTFACVPYPWRSCDEVYLPHFEFVNVAGFSQDRVVRYAVRAGANGKVAWWQHVQVRALQQLLRLIRVPIHCAQGLCPCRHVWAVQPRSTSSREKRAKKASFSDQPHMAGQACRAVVYISRLGGARFGLVMPTGRICTHLCWLVLCVQGEFYAPMSFNAFPFDTQYLSVQMQYGNKFPNSPVRIVPSGARATAQHPACNCCSVSCACLLCLPSCRLPS